MDLQPQPQDLPAFLDPLLDYLAEHLPPPLYDALFTAASYGLTLLTAAFSLVSSLSSWKPWEWDAQTVLPPLIMLLTAYYTLLSLYRTTSFMVRTTFKLIKWSAIIGVLGAGAGWFAGTNGGGEGGAGGALGMLRDMLQGQGQRGAGAGTGAGARRRTRTPRPRAYDSFNAHQQWQYNEEEARRAEQGDSASDAQRIIKSIASFAGQAMGGTAFDVLANAKSLFDGLTNPAEDGANEDDPAFGSGEAGSDSASNGRRRKQPSRKAKKNRQSAGSR